MQLHCAKDIEHIEADQTYRTPPWGMLLFPLVLLAICAGLGWAIINGHLHNFFWVVVTVLALLTLIVISEVFLPTLRPTNWVLKIHGNRLYLMLRNYRKVHQSDDGPTVASFGISEIASIGKQDRKLSSSVGNGRRTHWAERRLEMRLKEPVPEDLRRALDTEISGRARSYKSRPTTRNYPSPINLDGDTIQVLWNGRTDVIKPSIEHAIAELGKLVAVHETAAPDPIEPADLDKQQFDKLILQLCQSGDRITAVKMLRQHRGYSLSAAKQFIDELQI
ncbi:MAG: hypothetical protein ACI9HK_004977 [Pirellulaceae bacterium]|jgi:hypothetical protein